MAAVGMATSGRVADVSVWVDVDVRVRGLSACIPNDRQLAAIGRLGDLASLAARLVPMGASKRPDGAAPDPRTLIRRMHRRAGAMLRLVSHWSGQRASLLSPLFEDEDCRSLRALLRGVREGTPRCQVLGSLIPTPSLPLRHLSHLALSDDATGLAAFLARAGNPYGAALLNEVRRHPDLNSRVDSVLTHTYTERARRVAPRSGRAMRTYVERITDLANVQAALIGADFGMHPSAESCFAEGGTLVPREAFLEAVALGTRREAAMMLGPFLRASPLEAATGTDPYPEERILRALVREQRDIARLDPLGPAPIIEFVLRLRYTLLVVQRVVWSVAAESSMAGLAVDVTV